MYDAPLCLIHFIQCNLCPMLTFYVQSFFTSDVCLDEMRPRASMHFYTPKPYYALPYISATNTHKTPFTWKWHKSVIPPIHTSIYLYFSSFFSDSQTRKRTLDGDHFRLQRYNFGVQTCHFKDTFCNKNKGQCSLFTNLWRYYAVLLVKLQIRFFPTLLESLFTHLYQFLKIVLHHFLRYR